MGKYLYKRKHSIIHHDNLEFKSVPDNIMSSKRENKLLKNDFTSSVLSILKHMIIKYYLFKINNSKISNDVYQSELVFDKRGLGLKLFDFENDQVYTFYSDKNEFKKAVKYVRLIDNYFNTTLTKMSEKERVFVEMYVKNESTKNPLKPVKSFFNDACDMISDVLEKESFTSKLTVEDIYSELSDEEHELLDEVLDDKEIDEIKSSSFELMIFEFKNDLNMFDLLVTKSEYYVTDFDTFGEISSLELFFNTILTLSETHNVCGLELYKNGDFDPELKKIFESEEQVFHSQKRKMYLITYLIRQLTHRKDMITQKEVIRLLSDY